MEKIRFLDLRSNNRNSLKKTYKSILSQLFLGNYILDKNVGKFEKNFAKYNHAKFCCGVNSGHDAIKIALQALGLKKNDQVLVPGMTFISTYFAISELGAVPIPVDVGLDGLIDCNKLPKKINKKIKGIISVNLYGNLCDYQFLKKYSKQNKIFLLEDSSQSHGAFFKKKPNTKFWGKAATFSFYPAKNLGSITDGGAIISNDYNIFKNVKLIRNYGSNKKYYHKRIGCNSRLNSTSSIYLNFKLKTLNKINNLRKRQEMYYKEKLIDVKQISFLQRNKNINSSHHIFIIFAKKRMQLQNFLKKNNIETLIHYPVAPFLQEAYNKNYYDKKKFPISLKFQNEGLSLPLGEHINKKKQDYIIEKIISFYK